MIKVLFVGDIVGRPGRNFLGKHLEGLREDLGVDLVIANGENAAGGAGITGAIAEELFKTSVDAITLGDHLWDQRGFAEEIDRFERVCRPANLPQVCPGRTHLIVEHEGFRLGIFTVLGRTFMKKKAECPFLESDRKLEALKGKVDGVVVEIHAEATSEKVALGRYLDGRVSLVVGTHTHVPTADGAILPHGTAYMTDVGMVGPFNSVLGTDTQTIIDVFLDGMPRRFNVAEGDVHLCGCVVGIDEGSGLANDFETVCIYEDIEEEE